MTQPSEDPHLRTIGYYDAHAEEYVQSTTDLDLTELYWSFLAGIPTGGHLLDAGCGSGRDTFYFRSAGYRVDAFDASPRMVQLSSQLLRQEVKLGTFQTLDYEEVFDGIWACASLVHVPRAEMRDVLIRLRRALRTGGLLYASFKYGTDEGWEEERFVSRYTEDQLRGEIADVKGLESERVWITGDVRPGREEELWINLLARRVG